MQRYRIITLGCKVNQAESEALGQQLKRPGWQPASGRDAADLCVVNTCAVTQRAAMQSRQALRRAIHENPGACVVATGCYAQTDPDALAGIVGLDHIVGRNGKARLAEWVCSGSLGKCSNPNRLSPPAAVDGAGLEAAPPAPSANRTRPFLKIQDGCNAFCAYCIVPYARGPSRSLPIRAVLDGIRALASAGVHEVVLTGIHLGCYGRDLESTNTLLGLLQAVRDLPGAIRVRLSSIEPLELSGEILSLVASSERFCRHFHIPLQSGDTPTLRRMGRPYSAEMFAELVQEIRRILPDAAIGTDLLVGFPGETPAAFGATCGLIERLPLSYLHVFPFSARAGTAAFDLPDRVPAHVIKEGCRRLRQIGREKRSRFYRAFVGQHLPVVVEGRRDPETGLLKGVSSNYLPVLFAGPEELKNSVAEVMIEQERDGRLLGARVGT
ncbi:MAG: tRNA (N(6)-L-threonylcarbamoyladenosine(37)-C(2))-methylthiotransferase MtaB [Desulfobacterales bacterium]